MEKSTKNKDLNALVSLLDEPDKGIYKHIREKIFSFGIEAIPYLENAWENTFNDIMQERIEGIIQQLRLENLYIELNNWLHFNSLNLLDGLIIITKYQFPDLDNKDILKQFNKIKQDVWLELNENLTGLEKVKVLNHILFEIHKFKGNKSNIHAPHNSYINNVLESKKGNSVSLGILYIVIAQGLNIPIFGVNLPEHFILAYANEIIEKKVKYVDKNEILFYLNPIKNGAVFTRREVDLFIKQLKLKPEKSFYNTCNNADILKRLLNVLIVDYKQLGFVDKINDLKQLLKALD